MTRLCLCALALTIVCACKDTPPPSVISDGGFDSSTNEGGTVDGSLDGGDTEGGTDAGVPTSCIVTPADAVDDEFGSQLDLRMVATNGGMLLAWTQRRIGASPQRNAYSMRISPTGTLGTERTYLMNETTPGDPAVASNGTTSLFMFREPYDTMTALGLRPDLTAIALDANGVDTGVERVTNNGNLSDQRLALIGLSSGSFLGVYQQEPLEAPDDLGTGPSTFTAVFDATGTITSGPSALGVVLANGAVKLARSGDTIFTAYRTAAGALELLGLATNGSAVGSVVTVAAAGQVTETVDVALASATTGLAVWDTTIGGTKTEVHYRVFTNTGAFIGPERVLQAAVGHEARTPSVTPFAGGYVVAYRGTEDAGATWDTRVALIDQNGLLLLDTPAADLDAELGAMLVRVSPSGDVYLAWSDRRPATPVSGFRVRGGRLDCE